MKLLEEKILKDGKIISDSTLKVDSFLGPQIDTSLMNECGKEWYRLFGDLSITKIVTVESTGIGIACIAATYFGVPVLYAKKASADFRKRDYYSSKVVSFTHGHEYNLAVPKECIGKDDKILILDDFLANASAMKALITLCEKTGAEVVGCGALVEKVYKGGGNDLRERGYRVESLAMISSITDKGITFC